MLKRLLDGGEETDFILFCLEDDTSSEVQLINRFCAKKQTILLLTDPQDNTRADTVIDLTENIDFEPSELSNSVNRKFTKKDTVIVRSLTGLLLLFPVVHIARWLKSIQRTAGCLIVVLHSQGVEEDLIEKFSKLATTVLNIQSQEGQHNICSIVHSKPGGKIQRSREIYSFVNGELEIRKFVKSTKEEFEEEEEEDLADSLTTFKIGTSKAEEKAKKDLVLPFFTDQQKQVGEVKISGEETSKIYYEPDSGDDWDDEDPDDDLDI